MYPSDTWLVVDIQDEAPYCILFVDDIVLIINKRRNQVNDKQKLWKQLWSQIG